MPGFHALAHYNPAIVLLLGLATFAGVWGAGLLLLRALQLRIPGPWEEVAAALLGTATLALGVELLAVPGLASSSALVGLWLVFVALGSAGLLQRAARWRRSGHLLAHRGLATLSLPGVLLCALFIVASLLNLLLAMAPSTKIDEIYYQILPPSRIVVDGSLAMYVRPWVTAVLPQMGYMIAGAPLHAMGYIDAPNVWSCGLGLLLAWFLTRLVYEKTRSLFATLLVAATTVVGLYPSVYYTT